MSYKSLFVDHKTLMHTELLTLEPGASYPRHRYMRPQQWLVLRGEVDIDTKLRIEAGDFEWADGMISSLHDEVLV